MQVVNYSHARNNLRSLIDTVCTNDEEVIITTKDNQTVMMISLDTYNKTHAQVKRDIATSIEQYERGEIYTIDEAFEQAKAALKAHVASNA
jgi:antitoxin YefM